MTDEEAQLEGVRRWGELSCVRDRAGRVTPETRYLVGVVSNREYNNVLVHGEGPTWEDAFTDASTRAEFLKPYMQDIARSREIEQAIVLAEAERTSKLGS